MSWSDWMRISSGRWVPVRYLRRWSHWMTWRIARMFEMMYIYTHMNHDREQTYIYIFIFICIYIYDNDGGFKILILNWVLSTALESTRTLEKTLRAFQWPNHQSEEIGSCLGIYWTPSCLAAWNHPKIRITRMVRALQAIFLSHSRLRYYHPNHYLTTTG